MAALTESKLQQIIHIKYEQNTSTPSTTEDSYLVRRQLINDAIQKWGDKGREDNIRWRELYVNLADAATGDKTATTSDTTYAAPDDFVEMASFVKITQADNSVAYYSFVEGQDVMRMLKNDSTANFFYITGNESVGYTININSPVAGTINYSYYKEPAEMSTTTDKPEMGRPYFIVCEVLSELYAEERPDLATNYSNKAVSLLNAMLINNETPPTDTGQTIHDPEYELYGVRFGS